MRLTSVPLLALLVVALPSLVLGQATTAAPSSSSGSSAPPSTTASPSANVTLSASGNATASATGNSTSIASNQTTTSAITSGATSANSTPLTTAATPAELTNTAFTAQAPGASGTVASGPNDSYIAGAGRSAQIKVLGALGAVGLGAWSLL